MSSLKYGFAQPPYSCSPKPPGSWMTPSSETRVETLNVRMVILLDRGRGTDFGTVTKADSGRAAKESVRCRDAVQRRGVPRANPAIPAGAPGPLLPDAR